MIVHPCSGIAHVTALSNFRQRAAEKQEDLGVTAAAAQRYDEAM